MRVIQFPLFRTRLNVLVQLTLESARESGYRPVSFTRVHHPVTSRSKYHTQLAKLSFDKKNHFWSISQLRCIFSVFKKYT